MQQLGLDLGNEGVRGVPIQLTPQLQAQLVALLAAALLAVLGDGPGRGARGDKEDHDE